jgi:hypothetical protein
MKIALIILALILITGSFYVDYRWKKWMAERNKDRE